MIGRLLDARPQDGVLGEEGSSVAGSSGYTWVVDPIDGTVNYLYGFPHYAVSIALVEGDADPHSWRALAGAVVNPATGEAYTASAGGGAFLGETRLRAPEAVPLELALVGTGFAYRPEIRASPGRGGSLASCRACATSAAWARPRSTSAPSRPGASTRTSSARSAPGTMPPGRSSRAGGGRRGAVVTELRRARTLWSSRRPDSSTSWRARSTRSEPSTTPSKAGDPHP